MKHETTAHSIPRSTMGDPRPRHYHVERRPPAKVVPRTAETANQAARAFEICERSGRFASDAIKRITAMSDGGQSEWAVD